MVQSQDSPDSAGGSGSFNVGSSMILSACSWVRRLPDLSVFSFVSADSPVTARLSSPAVFCFTNLAISFSATALFFSSLARIPSSVDATRSFSCVRT